MIRRLSYTFLFFGVLAASAASAQPVSVSKCLHACGGLQISYEICMQLCGAAK